MTLRLRLFAITLISCLSFNLYAEPDITLTFPDCFPGCQASDKQRLLEEGKTEKLVLDAIAQAHREIRFSIYTFSRTPILNAMIEAADRRGVIIKGLVDRPQIEGLKPYCDDQGCNLAALMPGVNFAGLSLRDRVNILKTKEVYQKASNVGKLYLLSYQNEDRILIKVGAGKSRLMHNKFLIIDNKLVQTSSGNWSSTAMSVNFENLIQFNAPEHRKEIDAFICAFDAIWGGGSETSARLASCALNDKLFFTPSGSSRQDIATTVFNHIRETRHSIDISMHHLEHPQVYEELNAAAERGVNIRILFDDDDCPDKTPAAITRLLALSPATVRVQYLPTNCSLNQLSHNRFGIFDESTVINGSANWSKAGLKSNYESFVKFDGGEAVEQFKSYYDRLFENSMPKSECRCSLREETCRRNYCRGEFRPVFN
jgi:phosphatidylserine/phosphatidylglycerophosphate/cardiolipin synthase-like enzyme